MSNQDIYDKWRNSNEPKFTVWLTKQEEKCESCKEPCGNPWCPVNKDNKEEE